MCGAALEARMKCKFWSALELRISLATSRKTSTDQLVSRMFLLDLKNGTDTTANTSTRYCHLKADIISSVKQCSLGDNIVADITIDGM